MQILGIDPGRKRIGLALSDEAEGRMALPFRTVERSKSDVEAARAVRDALGERAVSRIVVGLPLRLDGTEGEAARRVRRFVAALEKELGLPVHTIDERLTTLSAERGLREMGVRASRRREVVDQSAAALILQSYLDSQERRATRLGIGEADENRGVAASANIEDDSRPRSEEE